MVGWSGQNRGLKADSCGFQKLSVVYSNSKNSGGQTHPKFAPKTMKPCQQTKTPLWVRSRPLDSPESEFNVRKSQDDGLPLEPCAISGGGCLMFPQIPNLQILGRPNTRQKSTRKCPRFQGRVFVLRVFRRDLWRSFQFLKFVR